MYGNARNHERGPKWGWIQDNWEFKNVSRNITWRKTFSEQIHDRNNDGLKEKLVYSKCYKTYIGWINKRIQHE